MKKLLLLIGLVLATSSLFAQEKGVYQIKYIGKFSSKTLEIKEVKLPTTLYLHGEQDKKALVYYSAKPVQNKIELLCSSHLIDTKDVSFDELKTLYRSKTSSLPIEVVVVDKQNWQRTKKVFITWNKVKFRKPIANENWTITVDFGTIEL